MQSGGKVETVGRYPGPANLIWRAEALAKLKAARVGPTEILDLLSTSAAEAMAE
jgi:hypothetical protein